MLNHCEGFVKNTINEENNTMKEVCRYSFLELKNGSVIYDSVCGKTLLLNGDFSQVQQEYEATVEIPTVEHTKFCTFVLNMTDECNLRCQYCSRYHEHYDNNSMSEEQLFKVISSVLNYAKRIEEKCVIQFHGGEPTLRIASIERVLKKFDKKELLTWIDFRIQTNGTNVGDLLIDVCNEYNIQVGISIDGPREITDKLRKSIGGFGVSSEVLKNIGVLRSKIKNTSLSCLCVVTKYSIDKAENIFDFMVENDIDDVSFLPLYNDYSCINDDKSIIPRNDELLEFSKVIIDKWISYLRKGKIICIPNYQIWIWNLISSNTDKIYDCHSCCGMGETILFIDKSGEIYPCGPFSYSSEMKYGNITSTNFNFDELKSTKLFDMIQHRLPSACLECALRGMCKCGCGANSYLNSQNILAQDPYCEYWKGIICYLLDKIMESPDIIELIPDYTIRL